MNGIRGFNMYEQELINKLLDSNTLGENEWEYDFIEKCGEILENKQSLSHKQKNKIREIYDKDLTRK